MNNEKKQEIRPSTRRGLERMLSYIYQILGDGEIHKSETVFSFIDSDGKRKHISRKFHVDNGYNITALKEIKRITVVSSNKIKWEGDMPNNDDIINLYNFVSPKKIESNKKYKTPNITNDPISNVNIQEEIVKKIVSSTDNVEFQNMTEKEISIEHLKATLHLIQLMEQMVQLLNRLNVSCMVENIIDRDMIIE